MDSRIPFFRVVLAVPLAFAMSAASLAQTYKVNQGTAEQQSQTDQKQTNEKKNQKQKNAQPRPQGNGKSLGWGSNIQNARLGHAAEAALKSGNYAAEYAPGWTVEEIQALTEADLKIAPDLRVIEL